MNPCQLVGRNVERQQVVVRGLYCWKEQRARRRTRVGHWHVKVDVYSERIGGKRDEVAARILNDEHANACLCSLKALHVANGLFVKAGPYCVRAYVLACRSEE